MLSCENFADLKKETMWKIISRDTLDVSEVTVWSACVRWAKNECQRQGRLVKLKTFHSLKYALKVNMI